MISICRTSHRPDECTCPYQDGLELRAVSRTYIYIYIGVFYCFSLVAL